jgi:ribose transport system substrate-binding protein
VLNKGVPNKGVLNSRVLLAAALLLALGACRGNRTKRIAVVPKANSHVFWVSVHAGAAAAGQTFGVEVLWNGPAQETEYDRQMQIVDSMIAQRVDGLAVAATERKVLNRSLDRAAELGIPVTVFDSGVDSTNYLSFIATNNYQAGQMAGRELARLVGGKGKVAVVMNIPGSLSTVDRERGFDEVIKAEFPKIEIVARQFSMSDRSKGMAAAENILTAHADLNGIFASSEPSSTGAALGIKSRGLAGKVKCVGFDGSDNLIDDLKEGTIQSLVVQDPFRMGFEAVKTLVDKLNGITPPKQIDLPARVVTKADLDKPEIHELLYPDVKKYLGST